MDNPFQKLEPLQPRLTDRAKKLLSQVVFAGEVRPVLDRPYVIKGWFDRHATSVVYGDANVGKSFWAIDVAHHVHNGIEWAGQRVRQGSVLYIAAEGGALFDNRLAARGAKFMVLRGALTLTGRNGDHEALAQVILHLTALHGPFALIVVDTLARVMGGADENAAPDVAALMKATDHVREVTGAHVMLIHHCGKDAARGARGHSSLRAAVDTEIEITKDEAGLRTAHTTKQRDMETGKKQTFRLRVVDLGRDSDGDTVTSCLVVHEGGQA